MKNLIAMSIFFSLIFNIDPSCVAGPSGHDVKFDGSWGHEKIDEASGRSYSNFTLDISREGDDYVGKYCFVTQFGAKIDCDPKSLPNMHGKIGQDGLLHMTFSSFGGAKGGLVNLTYQDNKIYWFVIKDPEGGDFFGPEKSVLERSDEVGKSNIKNNEGNRSAVITSDKALLLKGATETQATKGYLIKGDRVILLNRSGDGNYWKINYSTNGHGLITRWIRCEDVGLCQ